MSRPKKSRQKMSISSTEEASRKWNLAYRKAQLIRWGEMILGVPFSLTPQEPRETMAKAYKDTLAGKPLREPYMSDVNRINIASFLFSLSSPEKLDALTAKKKRGRGVPPKAETRGRNWNIGLDYEVMQEWINTERAKRNRTSTRSASGDAKREVAKAWGVTEKIVKDAYTQCRKLDGWREWALAYRQKFPLNGAELLKAISDELRGPKSG